LCERSTISTNFKINYRWFSYLTFNFVIVAHLTFNGRKISNNYIIIFHYQNNLRWPSCFTTQHFNLVTDICWKTGINLDIFTKRDFLIISSKQRLIFINFITCDNLATYFSSRQDFAIAVTFMNISDYWSLFDIYN